MSSNGKGAASAAPAAVSKRHDAVAILDSVENGIVLISEATEAEQLWRKVKVAEEALRAVKAGEVLRRRAAQIKLRAEARWGELLGEAESKAESGRKGGSRDKRSQLDNQSRKDRQRARQVAKVEERDPKGFEDYVENAPKPSREGLLRKTASPKKPKARPKATETKRRKAEPTIKGKSSIAHDPRVFDWVRRRIRAGWDRDQIVTASKENTDGWPLPDESLSNGGVSEIRSAIFHVERLESERQAERLRKAKSPAARLRILKEQMKKNSTDLLRLQHKAGDLVYRLYEINVEDYDLDDISMLAMVELYEDLTTLAEWMDRTIASVQGRLDDSDVRRKIAQLRKTDGRTPEEAETALRLADKLERKLTERLPA